MKNLFSSLLVLIAVGTATPLASAHFKLLAPMPTLVQDDRGNPQKLGPCGGTTADKGTPSNAVNKVKGGQKLHIKIEETVFHPGHYRVALAVNSPAQLPADPEVITRPSDRGPWSVSAAIAKQPQKPVLADGLFVHTERPARPGKPTSRFPILTARSARSRLSSSWPSTATTRTAAIFIIIAPTCRSRRIRANPWTPVGSSGSAADLSSCQWELRTLEQSSEILADPSRRM